MEQAIFNFSVDEYGVKVVSTLEEIIKLLEGALKSSLNSKTKSF